MYFSSQSLQITQRICLLGTLLISAISLIPTQADQEKIMHLLTGSIISRTLYALAELKIADHITESPQHITAIAQATSTNKPALYRALRLTASYGIFIEGPDEYFRINPLGKLLQTNHPDSLHYSALHEDNARWQAMSNLTHTLKTGEQAFKYTHGLNYFDYLNQHTEAAQQFDQSMANISSQENRSIAAHFNFLPYHNIIDVGGGRGGLLQEIMNRHQTITGTLYDLPYVVEQTDNLLVQSSPSCAILSGSFFEQIPTGYDLYLLKRIMHDWDDEQAIHILKNCRDALSDNARLLIIDAIVPSGNERSIIKDIDILLLALFDGRERTAEEFAYLFKQSGLQLVCIHKTPTLLSIFELRKA